MRYSGGFITGSPVEPSTSAAPGIWTLEEARYWEAKGQWPSPPAAAITLSYTDNAVDATNQSTPYTFTSRAIGSAAADRFVVVSISGSSGFSGVGSSVTIGGISASQLLAIDNGLEISEFWGAVVPSGTTADIVVTPSAGMSNMAIGVWAAYGASSTVSDTLTDTNSNPATGTIDVPTGGALIAIAVHRAGSATTFSWSATGSAEDFDATVETNTAFFTGLSGAYASASPGLSVSCTASQAGVRPPVLAAIALAPAA